MKTFLKILGGLIAIIILGIAAVFFFTGDLVSVADEFFVAAREGNMERAYDQTSADFRASVSPSQMEAFLRNQGLDDYQSASWSSRSIEAGRGRLQGTITTESGSTPVTLHFVKESGGWKIYHIDKPAAGIQTATVELEMPDESEQVRLVRESIEVFAASANAGSMADFYDHISELWRNQTSTEELDAAFRSFLELDADLSILNNYTPQFSAESAIDDEGVLVISGVYPTQPSQFYFQQKYVREGTGWKLIGFQANLK